MSFTESPDIKRPAADPVEPPNAVQPARFATATTDDAAAGMTYGDAADESWPAVGPDLSHDAIAAEAYALYAARGYRDGWDIEDWLEAEESLRQQRLDRE